ncbi:hypothetical protein CICLE_v10010804mg [Citrus x clementina]|uniref:Protein kinase domain-containing protein n=1 Tax=Citrus clementina TaxID=85681 RepID=V4ULB1_CITCL|nr:hypothetical protein CICLE_v10010804mg [Citrus x clementina]
MTGALDRDYQVCEQIGRGRFSIGFRCTSWIWGKSFAFKSIDKNLISGDSLDSQCILTEPKILQLLNPHHKIVQIFAVYENQFHFDIMLEFCNSQDLPTSSKHNLKPKNTVKISDFGSTHIIGGLKKTFFFFK